MLLIKRWIVTVQGYGDGSYLAPSRGRAIADAWQCDAFSHLTFGQFLKIARCRLDREPGPRFGDPITVIGKCAYFLENNLAYVRFAYPDGKVTCNAHPYDVLPIQYRPVGYQDRLSS